MTEAPPPQKTPLNRWHRDHGARMVDFAGWELPIQYGDGIISEHLQVRRGSGVFDISHMGRFTIEGDGAEAFLDYALTNAAHTLIPGTAHYTLLATPTGGAIDDAYLYRLGPKKFLLVVNAGNRATAWQALEARKAGFEATITDDSERLAMIALQGPDSERVVGETINVGSLPENKRNRLSTVEFNGTSLCIARTGYTGERVCFELFVPHAETLTLWEQLISHGANPIGLGARDSLRLEASLPLYGHELGQDEAGIEIPVLASHTSWFGVRKFGQGSYIGAEAITAQRTELEQLRAGSLTSPPVHLPRRVQPIAVPEGRRPLRPGHRVCLEGREIGYVTSGTSVPFSLGVNGEPLVRERPLVRPIGLALIESHIDYTDGPPVTFEIVDDRGRNQSAVLVRGNLNTRAPS